MRLEEMIYERIYLWLTTTGYPLLPWNGTGRMPLSLRKNVPVDNDTKKMIRRTNIGNCYLIKDQGIDCFNSMLKKEEKAKYFPGYYYRCDKVAAGYKISATG